MFHVRGIIGSADAAGEQSRLLKSYGVVWPECNFSHYNRIGRYCGHDLHAGEPPPGTSRRPAALVGVRWPEGYVLITIGATDKAVMGRYRRSQEKISSGRTRRPVQSLVKNFL